MASRTSLQAPSRPLLITDDPSLLDEMLRIAALAGTEVEVSPDLTSARPRYTTAPFVFVGVELATTAPPAALRRRPGVIMVGFDTGESPPWELAEALGAEHIALLPQAEPWLINRLTDTAAPRAAGRMVAVLGGRGGAGASVLATGLAVTGARAGLRVLLIDADTLGGGVDLVLGWESLDGLRWPGLSQTSGTVSAPALVEALPRRGELAVLSWDRGDTRTVPVDAMAAAVQAGRRGRDLVVADLPRHLDDAAATALAAADHTLLVVPAELRACAAAARVAAAAGAHTESISVVVRGPAPGGLKGREIARALGLPLAGTLRPEPDLARSLERGQPPAGAGSGPLAALCRRLLVELRLADGAVVA